jgi:hypothetical protein
MPFMEESALFAKIDFEPGAYGVPYAVLTHKNYRMVANASFPWALCPSSSMPTEWVEGVDTESFAFQMANYAGNSGSIQSRVVNPVS